MAGVPQTQVVSNSVSSSAKALLVKAVPPFGVCFTPCFAPSSSSSVAFAIGLASLSASLRPLGSAVTPQRWRAPLARLAAGWGARGQYLNRPSFRENRCGSPSGDTRHASRPAADHVHPWDSLVGSDTRVRLDQGASIA